MSFLLDAVNALVLGYFILIGLVYLVTTGIALATLQRYARRLRPVDVEDLISLGAVPPITLLVPAYNEEATIVESVRALLTLRYPDYEILVINDGSTDATTDRLQGAFDLEPAVRAPTARLPHAEVVKIWRSREHPGLWVLDKLNGRKADAMNAGLAFCRTPLFCAMDADTLLERDALTRIVRPFLERADTVAAGGIIRIANGCTVRDGQVTEVKLPRNLLARFQVLEYFRSFLAGRLGWSVLNGTLIISGAFGLFRRRAVVEIGGFATDTVGEDMELVVRLHRRLRDLGQAYRVVFVPDPVAWTEAPQTMRTLGTQRERWHRGLTQVMTRHRGMLFRSRYGLLGLIAYPYFFFLEMLGPIIELFGYGSVAIALLLGRVSLPFMLAYFFFAFVLGAALSMAAIVLEEMSFRRYPRFSDLGALMVMAALEPFGYRQINAYWRIRGLVGAWRGHMAWGTMPRAGFAGEPAA
jgi:cellulose synthase/poly-beta-1,6-N-acetylglucosamine synthase-like glycosyltransferase